MKRKQHVLGVAVAILSLVALIVVKQNQSETLHAQGLPGGNSTPIGNQTTTKVSTTVNGIRSDINRIKSGSQVTYKIKEDKTPLTNTRVSLVDDEEKTVGSSCGPSSITSERPVTFINSNCKDVTSVLINFKNNITDFDHYAFPNFNYHDSQKSILEIINSSSKDGIDIHSVLGYLPTVLGEIEDGKTYLPSSLNLLSSPVFICARYGKDFKQLGCYKNKLTKSHVYFSISLNLKDIIDGRDLKDLTDENGYLNIPYKLELRDQNNGKGDLTKNNNIKDYNSHLFTFQFPPQIEKICIRDCSTSSGSAGGVPVGGGTGGTGGGQQGGGQGGFGGNGGGQGGGGFGGGGFNNGGGTGGGGTGGSGTGGATGGGSTGGGGTGGGGQTGGGGTGGGGSGTPTPTNTSGGGGGGNTCPPSPGSSSNPSPGTSPSPGASNVPRDRVFPTTPQQGIIGAIVGAIKTIAQSVVNVITNIVNILDGGGGQGGGCSSPEPSASTSPGANDGFILAGAGNIIDQGDPDNVKAVAATQAELDRIIHSLSDAAHKMRILTLGDNAGPTGSNDNFFGTSDKAGYKQTWGSKNDGLGEIDPVNHIKWIKKGITLPTVGHVEFKTPPYAQPYYDYFTKITGDPTEDANIPAVNPSVIGYNGDGVYTTKFGGWEIISLNDVCSELRDPKKCAADSQQVLWLAEHFKREPAACVLVKANVPRFSSALGADQAAMDATTPLWNTLVDSQSVDLVLWGHDSVYERFNPMGKKGDVPGQNEKGVPAIIVGTGGAKRTGFKDVSLQPIAFRDNTDTNKTSHAGVLKLTLSGSGYKGEFITVDPTKPDQEGNVLDTFTGTCHGSSSSPTPTPGTSSSPSSSPSHLPFPQPS